MAKTKDIEGVKTSQQPSPGRILLTLLTEANADEAINRISKVIVELDIQIRSISLLSPSLDEIYLSYVQEGKTQ
jgi:hypothetical protein